MATQAEVDALTTAVGDIGSQLVRGLDEVSSEITRLKEALDDDQEIDLSALSSAVDALKPTAQALDDVVPQTIPAVDPEPAPGTDTGETPSADQIPFPGTVLDAASPGDVGTDGTGSGTGVVEGDATDGDTPEPEVTWPPVQVSEEDNS